MDFGFFSMGSKASPNSGQTTIQPLAQWYVPEIGRVKQLWLNFLKVKYKLYVF